MIAPFLMRALQRIGSKLRRPGIPGGQEEPGSAEAATIQVTTTNCS
jgi:hypothetical protein